MLQHLTTETGAHAWAIASLLFFSSVFLVVAIRLLLADRARYETHARLPLDESEAPRSVDGPSGLSAGGHED